MKLFIFSASYDDLITAYFFLALLIATTAGNPKPKDNFSSNSKKSPP